MPTREELEERRKRLSAQQLAQLRERLTGRSAPPSAAAGIPRRPAGPTALSFLQQRLWLIEQLQPGESGYHTVQALVLRGPLDTEALERSLSFLVSRHESLRTVFRIVKGQPEQVVLPGGSVVMARRQAMVGEDVEQTLRERALELRAIPFDLTEGPLWRTELVSVTPALHGLILVLHHLICDGWSMGILVTETATAYEALRRRAQPQLAPLSIQYPDYAAWQRAELSGPRLEAELAHWRHRLHGTPTILELPVDRPRPAVLTAAGAAHAVDVPSATARAVRESCRKERITPFVVLLASFQALVHRWSGQGDFLVGVPIINRPAPELELLIGLFANTIAVRARLEDEPTFRDLLARVAQEVSIAQAHQDVPFDKLVEELVPGRDLSRQPLVQAVFTLELAPAVPKLDQVTVEVMDLVEESSPFELALLLHETAEGGFAGKLEYSTSLFDRTTIEALVRRWLALLEQLLAAPDRPVGESSLLLPEDVLALAAWNDTLQHGTEDISLDEMVVRQARWTPSAIAIESHGRRLTYQELDEGSRRFADALAARCRAGARVGLCIERSLELVSAMLGILRAGLVCVPLDLSLPRPRLMAMLQDAEIDWVLASDPDVEALRSLGARTLTPAAIASTSAHAADDRRTTGKQIAFVLYTSGSTGQPKGVFVHHGGLVTQMRWMKRAFALGPSDRGLQKGSLGFLPSLCELFAPLCSGGRVVMADPSSGYDPGYLVGQVRDGSVTLLEVVPSILEQLVLQPLFSRCTSLRHVFAGGEALPAALVHKVKQALPAAELHNLYGATEVSGSMTCWTCTGAEDGIVPVGRPTDEAQVYVLDSRLRMLPPGSWGELCVGGSVVSSGYLRSPELTAQKFIADVSGSRPGRRLYRTGDEGRFRADGALEVRGRLDEQVKIRGQRIELGEVEHTLREYPTVTECVVQPFRTPSSSELRLCGYVVQREPRVAPEELRRFLQERLPPVMIPDVVMTLDALPLNRNGKVDRRALTPPPEASLSARTAYVPPRSPLEECVAEVFRTVLKAERVGVEDDFFALGGHSLRAAEIASRLRLALDVELPLSAVFQAPTVAALAARLADAPPARPELARPIPIASRSTPLAASYAQQAILQAENRDPAHAWAHLVPLPVRLRGPLDVPALGRALDLLVERHEALRTTYSVTSGAAWQHVHSPASAALHVEDFCALPPAESARRVQQALVSEAATPLDLSAAVPLLRARLLKTDPSTHTLLLTLHRIAYDGASLGILISQLSAAYEALSNGRAPVLRHLPVQYADFAQWERARFSGTTLDELVARWRARLHETGQSRDEQALGPARRLSSALPPDLLRRLEATAVRSGASLFSVGMAAIARTVAHHTGEGVVSLTSHSAARHRPELERLIGRFANLFVVQLDVAAASSDAELIARARDEIFWGRQHELPYALLREHVTSTMLAPLRFAFSALHHTSMQALSFRVGSIEVEPIDPPAEAAECELDFAIERRPGLELALNFRPDRVSEDTAQRVLNRAVETLDLISQ